MSGCPGLHCPGCGGDLGRLLGVLGGVAAVAGLAWVIVTFLWLIAALAGLALAAVIAIGVWMRRRGGDVATVSRPEIPPPYVTPLPFGPAGALPAARQLHIHLHGMTPAEAAERLASIREADYRACDSWRDQ